MHDNINFIREIIVLLFRDYYRQPDEVAVVEQ